MNHEVPILYTNDVTAEGKKFPPKRPRKKEHITATANTTNSGLTIFPAGVKCQSL
jgi:hypothetical protein